MRVAISPHPRGTGHAERRRQLPGAGAGTAEPVTVDSVTAELRGSPVDDAVLRAAFVEADLLVGGLSRPAPEQDVLDAVIAERAGPTMVISGAELSTTGGRKVVVRMVLADLLPSQA